MKKGLSLALVVIMSLAVLLTGCGNSEQVESNSESSSTAQMEDTSSSEAESSSEPETSEPDIVPEEPEESDSSTAPESGDAENGQVEEENSEMQMNVQVGGSTFTATLEENEAVDALVDMMEQGPVTIQMSDYSGFEKVGPLGTSLPTSNQQTTTQAGDIVLYQGNQIVMFYGSNSWSYTRLGHIDDLTGWEEALGSGDVTVTFSLED
ncbi:MAG: cyclophilin-like fold protein [Chordicoccus sp.]